MNKLIILTFAIACFTACKKDYTCTCTNTSSRTDFTGTVYTTGESTQKFNKVSKKFAREHCISSTDVQTSGSGSNEVKVETVHGCVLS